MNKRLKTVVIVLATICVLACLLVGVGPFLIPVTPLQGLVSAEEIASTESKFITIPFDGTDGIDIHYISGESDFDSSETTYVLLHGSNFNAYTWNEVISYFDTLGNVVAYDQIPYGLSEKLVEGDWSVENPYTTDAAINQLFLFLDALEVKTTVLVGSSYGGTLAVQATLAQPERVEALILVDAAVYVQEEMPAWMLNLPQVRKLGPMLARQLGRSETFNQQTYMNPEMISADRMNMTLIQTKVENWDVAYWEYLRVWGSDSPDMELLIPNIKQPALVISGDGDVVVPVEDSQRLDSELPNSELIILPSCGHVPQEECPDAFIQAVGTWLER